MSNLTDETLRKYIRELVDDEIEEMTGTGAVDGFGTPHAFQGDSEVNKKKRKSTATSTAGYEIVGEAVEKRQGFDQRANEFIRRIQKKLESHYKKSYPNFRGNDVKLTVNKGSKYWRLVSGHASGQSVWGFLNTQTGDILKAAGWKAPAKGARGNIFDSDYGIKGVGPFGPAYKRGPSLGWAEGVTEGSPIQYGPRHPSYVAPVNEGGDPYYAWRNDTEKSPRAKIGEAIGGMNSQLREMEKSVKRCRRLRSENNLATSDYWKRTNNALMKMESRMHNIAKMVRDMRG